MDSVLFKALADDNRLAIVRSLSAGERCVCELADELALSDALVSHHVKVLVRAEIVTTRRMGKWVYCRLDPSTLASTAEQLSALAQAAAEAPARSLESVEDCTDGRCDQTSDSR